MTRGDFLNRIIKLQWGDDPSVRYLELGSRRGKTFNQVRSDSKCSVDPIFRAEFRMTSDEFFAKNLAGRKLDFDLVFVDGLHQREQVVRDVFNSLACLAPGGVIVLDDCLPSEECQQLRGDAPVDDRPWLGDVWKAVVDLGQDHALDICVIDEMHGFGVVLPRPSSYAIGKVTEPLTWAYYRDHKQDAMNIIQLSGLASFLKGEQR